MPEGVASSLDPEVGREGWEFSSFRALVIPKTYPPIPMPIPPIPIPIGPIPIPPGIPPIPILPTPPKAIGG